MLSLNTGLLMTIRNNDRRWQVGINPWAVIYRATLRTMFESLVRQNLVKGVVIMSNSGTEWGALCQQGCSWHNTSALCLDHDKDWMKFALSRRGSLSPCSTADRPRVPRCHLELVREFHLAEEEIKKNLLTSATSRTRGSRGWLIFWGTTCFLPTFSF